MTDLDASRRPAQTDEIRRVAGEALSAVASALNVAAVVVGVLACVVWVRSAEAHGQPDFPGRYLFALLPLLTAAGTLKLYARSMERESP